MKKNYYTIKEYCKLTGTHKNTIYSWIKKGDLETMQKTKRGRHLIPYWEIPSFIRKEKNE